MPRNQRDRRVRPLNSFVHSADRIEHLLGAERQPGHALLKLVREHIQQQLRVGVRVQVAPIDIVELGRQLTSVGQIAVVHEDQTVGRIHIERLRLFLIRGCATRGVAHMPEPDMAEQGTHVAGTIRLAHLPASLHHVELAAIGGGDSRRILTAMLQQQQAVVDLLVHVTGGNDADDAAHVLRVAPANGSDRRAPRPHYCTRL